MANFANLLRRGAGGEGWPWVDKLPMDRGCDPSILKDGDDVEGILHAGSIYGGKWALLLAYFSGFFVQCYSYLYALSISH